MSAVLASARLSARQVLVRGRIGETITGRSFDGVGVELRAVQDGVTVPLPVSLAMKPGGWYAAHLAPGRVWPVFPAAPGVTLEAEISVPGRAPVVVSQAVDPADLALVAEPRQAGETAVEVERIAGAPFRFDLSLSPLPVALSGTVIRDHDPDDPFPGVSVSAPGGLPVVTDAAGQFFIAELPVLETMLLSLDGGSGITEIPFRPDYARRVNSVTLSLGGA
ncbi:hypothetical protein [Mangrovicoccus ximenensis]|uniref:hypothetical protein n=1 Tax=Mangrovicoccus ximenensis TaxID=1911570 RepID=UPI000D3DC23E|nr:hypothetical protein [Mangrovicoccus ximenensis]